MVYDVDEVKQRTIDAWHGFKHRVVDNAVIELDIHSV